MKAQTSDETQPFKNNENSAVVIDDMLPPKEASHFHLFFTRGLHNTIDLSYISQNCFHFPKSFFLE